MSAKLFFQAIGKFTAGLLIVALLLFLPAGSLSYAQAWLFLGILFIPMFGAGIVMMIKNPELLKKRLNAKETESDQKTVILLSAVMFTAAFIVAGLNYRFGWLVMPMWLCVVFAVVFLSAYLLYAEVLHENVYLSRTIEVQEDQKIIDTGLYGVVRHPMYMSTLLLFLSMPLVLGSLFSFAIILFYIPMIIVRIKGEERVLEAGLPGYTEYKKRVKYRLIPFIW